MSYLVIRDPVSGKVLMTDADMVGRYVGMLEIPTNFVGVITYRNEAFNMGKPYYIYDSNGNVANNHNYTPWGGASAELLQVSCTFAGSECTVKVSKVLGAEGVTGLTPSYVYFGVY